MSYVVLLLLLVFIVYVYSQDTKETYVQNVATERDEKLAIKEALRKRCIKGGYVWKPGPTELDYDCVHTKKTCLRDSVYPTPAEKDPRYYEWRSEPGNDRCIIANEGWREFCEKEGLSYNPENGLCKTNRQYCMNKGLPFCNGDCFVPPLQWLSEQIFGTTLGRTLAQASPERWIAEGACRADDAIKENRQRQRDNE